MFRNKNLWMLLGLLPVLIAVFSGLELFKAADGLASGNASGNAAGKPKSLVTTWNGDPRTSRAFTWHSGNPDAAALVQYKEGEHASLETVDVYTVKGNTTSLDIGQGGAEGVHKASITNLKPGTVYTYRVGDGSAGGWSDSATFTTETEAAEEFTFLNVTDSQGVTQADFALWGRTLQRAFTLFPEAVFIVHNGDFTEDPEDEAAWESLFNEAKPWVTRLPFMPVTGNHDEVDKKADRFVSHFQVPGNGAPGSIAGTTYSFDYGYAHITVLNTESNIKEQAEWLRKDLAATRQPWKIIAIHRPAYGGSQDDKVLKRWVPVFEEFGVNLVLQGHNHEYSRSYPITNNSIAGDNEGTVYVVANTSGPKFNKKKDDQSYHRVHFQNYKQMFAGIRIGKDALTYEAYDADGGKLDEFVLRH